MTTKEQIFNVAMYLIALSDEGLETKQLKKAIEEIKKIIYIRENMPF